MTVDDLPLFNWTPPKPTRQILIFPMSRRIGKVRHTALKLLDKSGDDATLYWKQVMSSARKHLQRIGLSKDEADDELRAFFEAVQAELVRITYIVESNGGAG